MRPSDERLVSALREIGLDGLAQRAARGEFNDFFGDHAMPKMELVKELERHDNTQELIRRIKSTGDFDSGAEEGAEWYASDEGQAVRGLLAP